MVDQLSWIDPDGAEFVFDGSWYGVMANFGIRGRFGAPFDYIEQMLPLEHGSQVTNVQVRTAETSVPWDGRMVSQAAMRTWFDEASWVFNPLRGKGKLRNVRGDGTGTVREFSCYLKSGFESIEEGINLQVNSAPKGVWVFRGGPFWEAAVPVTVPLDTNSPTGTWLPVTFPWRFADSSVFAQVLVANPGPVAAWPTIFARGPGSGLTIRNLSTDDYLTVDYAIPAGEAIQIETRTAGRKRIYLQSSGLDLMGYTSGSMFPIGAGNNQLSVEFGGASSASLVQIEFYPRYFNP